jgi:transcriptional regulator with XRE-family HTH domain
MTQLEFLRRTRGLTQEELARRSGASAKSIANLERGHWARPSAQYLERLAEALEVDSEEATRLLEAADAGAVGRHREPGSR